MFYFSSHFESFPRKLLTPGRVRVVSFNGSNVASNVRIDFVRWNWDFLAMNIDVLDLDDMEIVPILVFMGEIKNIFKQEEQMWVGLPKEES